MSTALLETPSPLSNSTLLTPSQVRVYQRQLDEAKAKGWPVQECYCDAYKHVHVHGMGFCDYCGECHGERTIQMRGNAPDHIYPVSCFACRPVDTEPFMGDYD